MGFKDFFILKEENDKNKTIESLDNYLFDILVKEYNKDIWDINFWTKYFVPHTINFFIKRGFLFNGDQGRNRLVMTSDKRSIVIKIPKNLEGLADNDSEFLNQKVENGLPDEKRGRNKRVYFPKLGIPILIMEKLVQVNPKDIPDWGTYYDSGQVGRNKKGIIKAYDYGMF